MSAERNGVPSGAPLWLADGADSGQDGHEPWAQRGTPLLRRVDFPLADIDRDKVIADIKAWIDTRLKA